MTDERRKLVEAIVDKIIEDAAWNACLGAEITKQKRRIWRDWLVKGFLDSDASLRAYDAEHPEEATP